MDPVATKRLIGQAQGSPIPRLSLSVPYVESSSHTVPSIVANIGVELQRAASDANVVASSSWATLGGRRLRAIDMAIKVIIKEETKNGG